MCVISIFLQLYTNILPFVFVFVFTVKQKSTAKAFAVVGGAAANEEFRKPMNLPKILDGKFYNNIQPHPKTAGGIQATCTSCFGIISGTTKSTGNFLSHIKRRHKDILATCQLYCSAKSLTCFIQDDVKQTPVPVSMTSAQMPLILPYCPVKEVKPVPTGTTTTTSSTSGRNVITTFARGSQSTTPANNSANGVYKQ